MKKKQEELIRAAIKLFAEKGFQTTTVQDIVNACGISKGAFYTYFASKDELLIEIFQYYFNELSRKVMKIDKEKVPPREKAKKQLISMFEFCIRHRDFIVMLQREQSHSINEGLRVFFEKKNYAIHKYHKTILLSIYGENYEPYVFDAILVYGGICQSYMKLTVIDGVQVNLEQLSEFILDQLDFVADGFLREQRPPLVLKKIEDLYPESRENDDICGLLTEMKEKIADFDLEPKRKQELQNVILILKEELNRDDIRKSVFQGMLAHFNGIKELQPYCQKIARALEIKLLP
ncbi:TetR/AcrR family transcriptional regulator [Heyndrickxia acidiproducens]|uniref:TetR/AcrR family transcriptional regulator n=1 Tax=Heyndrickxia acidiproducens TaxID=1121084 RepID=UPI00146E0CFC|nr:TetR/AcrR family transcriptional regulator [Heyndrickxia acidiproducens]